MEPHRSVRMNGDFGRWSYGQLPPPGLSFSFQPSPGLSRSTVAGPEEALVGFKDGKNDAVVRSWIPNHKISERERYRGPKKRHVYKGTLNKP